MLKDNSVSKIMNDHEVKHWNVFTRILFRFTFSYLFLCGVIIWNDMIGRFHYFLTGNSGETSLGLKLQTFVPWVANHILHFSKNINIFGSATGSDDTTFDWTRTLLQLILALVATAIWSALDRKRPHYRRLHAWLRLFLRLGLAMEMFDYGFDKVIPLQFGELTVDRLLVPVGQLTPFALLWSFMAASKAYTIFGGLVEVLGGVLLLIPRLTTLGAILLSGALTNVFLLNMSYDVPVKLFSFHLLLISIYLMPPEIPRFVNVLILNRPTGVSAESLISETSWIRRTAQGAATVLGMTVCIWILARSCKEFERRHLEAASNPIYNGIWVIDKFSSTGDKKNIFTDLIKEHVGLRFGGEEWKKVIIANSKTMAVQFENFAMENINIELKPASNLTSVSDDYDPDWKGSLMLNQIKPERLEIHGVLNKLEISLKLHKVPAPNFALPNRGFHFINERVF